MNETYPVAYADKPNDAHWRKDTVTWDEIIKWVKKPAKRKECGNYILATLEETSKVHAGANETCVDVHRDNRSVSRRSAVIALDIDTPDDGFDVAVEVALADYTYVMHTTHSSTPSEPRYRLLVQVDRDMAPDEYVEAAQGLAERVGKDQFDAGSFQPARFMYKPATRKPEWYDYRINEGSPVPVDELLADFDRNLADKPMPKPGKNKRDPFEIDGPVGAFNRVYADLDDLIEAYDLPYDRVSEDRYQLRGAATEAGMGPVSGAPGLFYSHHANDPAYGTTCSAFDLVRLHWFGDEDENAKPGTPVNKLPSNEAMMDKATRDPRVVNEMFSAATSDLTPLGDDEFTGDGDDDSGPKSAPSPAPASWRGNLRLTRQGRFQDVVQNWDLIKKHDPVFGLLYFNQLSASPEVRSNLPWREVTPLTRTFDGVDHAQLRFYIEREYDFRCAKEFVDALVITKAGEHPVNPVKGYLESLEWDGKPRLETCLPGVQDTLYNRLVARKVLAAAVARVFDPGCKWDHALVLHGTEGLGKTTWIEKMAHVGIPERRTYMYSLGAINSKDTLLAMHLSWIILADEGHSLRKSDTDSMKEFLTRNNDVFRMPYDRDTVVHPRQCVIWSTTNDDVFLRRQEGNRRFLMVRVVEKFNPDTLTTDTVDQIWAEAVHLYRGGERLWLTDSESKLAALERDPFVEEDTNAGVLQEFLDLPVPADWWKKSAADRAQWADDVKNGFESAGVSRVNKTCSRQLWHEALGQTYVPRKVDLLDITASLKELGWKSSGSHHFPGYGTQTVFVRPEPEDDYSDLI